MPFAEGRRPSRRPTSDSPCDVHAAQPWGRDLSSATVFLDRTIINLALPRIATLPATIRVLEGQVYVVMANWLRSADCRALGVATAGSGSS